MRLSHATKIVPCKSALSQPVPAYKDALLHRKYKHCFSKVHFTVPKYNILHISSSSVKSINLTNIPTPRQLLQKNSLIRSPTSKSLTTLLCKRAAVRIELLSQKTRMTCTLAIFGEKSQTFACNPKQSLT